jgi:adenylate cyclase
MKPAAFHVGYKSSIITLFVAVVLFVGLTLVYLSFERIAAITQTAASSFIDKVAQLGADRIDSQFRSVRDSLQILAGPSAVQSAELVDNVRLYRLMAAMLRNNEQLFNIYVGYADGSFLEMDVIDRAGPEFRKSLNAPDDAVFRLFTIVRSGATQTPAVSYLSNTLVSVGARPGPSNYDPRRRPWYLDALTHEDTLITGPYVFYATGLPGYTLRIPLREGRRGVVAGDILLSKTEAMLLNQRLGRSGFAFLFDDADRVVAHPEMSKLAATPNDKSGLPRIDDLKMPGLTRAILRWRAGGPAQQFFRDGGRSYVAAFQRIETAGSANLRLAVVAPIDEFFSEILAERRWLFALALGFVAAVLPFVVWLGARLSRSLRELALQTDSIQRFELAPLPRLHSVISEIDDLGNSVFTMRNVVRNFASFVPKQIVRQLIETGTALELGGSRREITVLFTDVADFTAKTEKADPSDVMLFTSRYFAALSSVIMNHHGTIDKFIGDSVMAFWNAPADDDNQVRNACAAVAACLRRNDELNDSFRREGWPPYETRFGLHVGDAVVGNIGSSDRMNYTALGATVNLASRLEGLNKSYGTRVLVSSSIKQRAESHFVFRSVDRLKPKGFAEAFTIYELRCEGNEHTPFEFAFCQRWEQVFAIVEQGDAGRAQAALRGFLDKYPTDGVAQYHASRLAAALAERPAGGSMKTDFVETGPC